MFGLCITIEYRRPTFLVRSAKENSRACSLSFHSGIGKRKQNLLVRHDRGIIEFVVSAEVCAILRCLPRCYSGAGRVYPTAPQNTRSEDSVRPETQLGLATSTESICHYSGIELFLSFHTHPHEAEELIERKDMTSFFFSKWFSIP